MKYFSVLSCILTAALACCPLSGCSREPASSEAASPAAGKQNARQDEPSVPESALPEPEPIPPVPALDEIRFQIQGMSLREKAAQLFIVTPDALELSSSGTDFCQLEEILEKYPVGGMILFAKDLISPEQTRKFHDSLQSASKIPLFLCVDEEGGSVARLARNPAFSLPSFPDAGRISSDDPESAFERGAVIGSYLREFGFNMDFAPVADVNTNPQNPVIGTRSFSSDPETAAAFSDAMADGLQSQSIIPAYKHFPGHGDTRQDSHAEIAVLEKSEQELKQCELMPFTNAGELDCIMAGHIAVPALTGDLTPATLSEIMVQELLRDQMGFQGLIVTDSLSMKAVTNTYDSGQAAVAALKAGCDLLLMPLQFQEALHGVVAAAESGELPESRLDQSLYRILRFKKLYNAGGHSF